LGLRVIRTRGRYAQDGLVTIHRDAYRGAPSFRAAYARGLQACDGVDPRFEWRVHVALWAARLALRVRGDFVECGVNAGFMSSAIMHDLQWTQLDRRYYLVDTFAGPPLGQYDAAEIAAGRRRVAEDALRAGAYVVDLARIRRNFAEWPNAIVVQGAVPDVLPVIPSTQVAFLHLDMNSARPERAALAFFWDKLARGGIVLLDDYAYRGHEQQGAAIDAVARGKQADVLALPTGQGLIVR
jgi:hypothetical protein